MIDSNNLGPELIDSLVADQVPESRTLEYKRNPPGTSDEEKREFLADVSSFANADGGVILYGIEDAKAVARHAGLPAAAPGLVGYDHDSAVQRLENILRDGIEPRISGVEYRPIPRPPQNPVLAIRIRQSWCRPHMVTFKGASRFYSRNSAGKYQLDVGEIRSAFLLTDQLGERIRRFRLERLDLIMSGGAPVPLMDGIRSVLHAIPIDVFGPALPLVPSVPIHDETAHQLVPLGGGGADYYYNFDGLLATHTEKHHPNPRYLQLFRNGAIEAVNVYRPAGGVLEIPSVEFERNILQGLPKYQAAYKTWGLAGPGVLMLSLLGVKGAGMSTPAPVWSHYSPIDRDVLVVPDLWLEHMDVDLPQTLRPAFDAVWQAAGHEACLHYAPNGDWQPLWRDLPHYNPR